MPEDVGFDEVYAITTLNDPVTEKFIDVEENDGISAGLSVADCSAGGKMITGIVDNSYIRYNDGGTMVKNMFDVDNFSLASLTEIQTPFPRKRRILLKMQADQPVTQITPRPWSYFQ